MKRGLFLRRTPAAPIGIACSYFFSTIEFSGTANRVRCVLTFRCVRVECPDGKITSFEIRDVTVVDATVEFVFCRSVLLDERASEARNVSSES